MKTSILRLTALALLSVFFMHATPRPRPLPAPILPSTPLHTEFKVQVNHMGQIVRVKSGKQCKVPSFNAQTYGNVLQMFIRHPDGSATVGLYKVAYDYDPKTKLVHRGIQLLSAGGDWGDEQGAANQLMDLDRKNRERHLALPGMDKILARPKPKATKKPK
ncbi:MAG: hypothetical protein M3126_02260 [Candidatus Eremiobacteraeota bacterium]|nr:hypothetical protein [Candidatus Eremiobacteraeota bacterium]